MDPYALPSSPHSDIAVFTGNTLATAQGWHVWTKPPGKAMAHIVVIGGGGSGGTGVIGAVSNAAGGGGGGGGGVTVVDMPLALLPARLYISVAASNQAAGNTSAVTLYPVNATVNYIAYASGGAVGGDASGATAGTGGAGGLIAAASSMPMGAAFMKTAVAGQAGTNGGTTGVGSPLTLPQTGVRTTGGTGGGGLPASGNGTAGGLMGGTTPPYIRTVAGGAGPGSAVTPANRGLHGTNANDVGWYYQGGTGGSSTYATATGGGLVQAAGGNGGIGSGGGGMGGALTGSTAAAVSYGGAGIVIITCY